MHKEKEGKEVKITRSKMRLSSFYYPGRRSHLACIVLVLSASPLEFRKDMVKVASSAIGIAAMQALFKKNHAPATRAAEAMAVYTSKGKNWR